MSVSLSTSPRGAAGVTIGVARGCVDLAAEPWPLGREVASLADDGGIDEVLVQMIDELGDAVVHPSGDGDIVEHRQVLHELAQSDAADMRADRHAELRRHQDDREIFVHAAETAAVDLTEVDRLRVKQLLEQDADRAVLAGGDAD